MLPKIDLPIFETTLPSSGEKVKYRAFTVKEEKILLVAQESNDIGQTILAIKQLGVFIAHFFERILPRF